MCKFYTSRGGKEKTPTPEKEKKRNRTGGTKNTDLDDRYQISHDCFKYKWTMV